jgi:hypothetical protein
VTVADLQRVARKYLLERNRTVATLIPEQIAEPGQAAPDQEVSQ